MSGTTIKLIRQDPALYTAGREPVLVTVPEFSFAMIDGRGDPADSSAYVAAIEALYAVSYGAKFAIRGEPHGLNYAVMPLEGLWSVPGRTSWVTADRSEWEWTMMIRQPAEVTAEVFDAAREKAAEKVEASVLEAVRLDRFAEGDSAQVMHVGPYAAELPTIERLHDFIEARGLTPTGRHHELYLGDPKCAAPDKLRTILRQPVAHPTTR